MLTKDGQTGMLNSVAEEETPNFDQPQLAGGSDKPQRIGGFLIFVAVGLFLSLLQNIGYFLDSLAPVIRRPLWERLTDPDSPAYHPYWESVLIYEATTSSFILLANIIILWLFLRKKRFFPTLIVVLIPIIFVMSLAGYYLSGFIPAVAENKEYVKQGHALIVKFVGLHIWIPYFLVSRRVGRTFVR